MSDKEKLESLTRLIGSFDESIKAVIKAQGESDFTKGAALIIELLKYHI